MWKRNDKAGEYAEVEPQGRSVRAVRRKMLAARVSQSLQSSLPQPGNTGESGERGLTVPRLLDLIDAHPARRRRTLREWGRVIALAQHDPKRLARELQDPVQIEAPTSGPLTLTRRAKEE